MITIDVERGIQQPRDREYDRTDEFDESRGSPSWLQRQSDSDDLVKHENEDEHSFVVSSLTNPGFGSRCPAVVSNVTSMLAVRRRDAHYRCGVHSEQAELNTERVFSVVALKHHTH